MRGSWRRTWVRELIFLGENYLHLVSVIIAMYECRKAQWSYQHRCTCQMKSECSYYPMFWFTGRFDHYNNHIVWLFAATLHLWFWNQWCIPLIFSSQPNNFNSVELFQLNKCLFEGLLKDYSKWLARFPGDLTDYKLEVPGQYGTSMRKPLPEYHVNVAGFDEKVCCRFINCCFCDFINLGLLRAIYECIC